MIPTGKLKVNGGNVGSIMTGWYIVEKLESIGKNVTWNKYTCAPTAPRNTSIAALEKAVPAPVPVATPFTVNVFPNPSADNFRVAVSGKGSEPITVRIMDNYGRVLSTNARVSKEATLTLGEGLKAGTYFAEVTQGSDRQMVRLVKL